MKLRYEKDVKVMEEIELEVPYYYEEIEKGYRKFGKVTDGKIIDISFGEYKSGREVKVEKWDAPETELDYILRYCTESTKEKFEAARKEALGFFK